MNGLSKVDIAELFEMFLNENGMYWKFKDFIEEHGYTVEELGFQTED